MNSLRLQEEYNNALDAKAFLLVLLRPRPAGRGMAALRCTVPFACIVLSELVVDLIFAPL